MLKSILLISAFSCFLQDDVKTGNAHVQLNTVNIHSLPADVQKKINRKKPCLILPEKNNLVMKGKLKYIKAYLVNHTGKPVNIQRADGSLAGVSSQVYENNEWKVYQIPHPVFCGNSYWSQTLENGKALVIHYDYAPGEKTMVQLRLHWGMIGEAILSNSILVQK